MEAHTQLRLVDGQVVRQEIRLRHPDGCQTVRHLQMILHATGPATQWPTIATRRYACARTAIPSESKPYDASAPDGTGWGEQTIPTTKTTCEESDWECQG